MVVSLLAPIVGLATPSDAAVIGRLPAGAVLRVAVPEAIGGKTVVGQLTVDRASGVGFVTAYGCEDGIPTDADGSISRSDRTFGPRQSTGAVLRPGGPGCSRQGPPPFCIPL